ncbi:serine/threonine protein kinase [Rippkaea orientalis PCC 8801]|uniref:Serine/threonine protein kinase n=2 Tax=Rippkaea TaxID=2546365 RepID=B7K3X2_RIPO1|nr:serine/threonine protein kinase [Rippkaea orientalis PCC 8801]
MLFNHDIQLPPRRVQLPQYGETIENKGKKYSIGKQIGSGNFGKVFECSDDWGNELVAKIIMPQKRSYKEVQQEWKEELKKLLTFRHPNITYIYDAFEYKDTCYLIIEYCDYTLQDIFKNCDQELRESLIPYIAKDLLQGIDFIHSIDYVHKDIHPGHVFVRITKSQSTEENTHFICKIGDLGISNLENNIDQFNTILAQWMLPPEFLNSQKFGSINRQVDIYHTGLLLLSLLLGTTRKV